jgi:bifunctional oligoribonuclease and PAP phosphatase NrnA
LSLFLLQKDFRVNSQVSMLSTIKEYLASFDTYYLVGHIDPDADCLGSALALGHYLERNGKGVRYFNEGPFDRTEIRDMEPHFLQRIDSAWKRSDPNPAVVILDCSGPERVGEDLAADLAELPLAIIDHHPVLAEYNHPAYVDSTAPACALLVQRFIEFSGSVPDAYEAGYLFLGFATDTGFLRHLESNHHTSVAGAARLMEAGASPRETYHRIFGGQSFVSRKLLGRILDRMESHFDGQLLITYQTRADIEELGHEARDSSTVYEMMLGVSGVRAVAFLRDDEDGNCVGSLRSVDETDMSVIANLFGGGGHRRAAGFLTKQARRQVKRIILSELAHQLEAK